jgi:chromosome segregation ATPase
LIRSLQDQITALSSERDRLLARVGDLEQSLNIATAEQNTLRNQLNAINDALAKAAAQVESLKLQNRLYTELDATDLDGKLVKALDELTPPLDALSASTTSVNQRTKAVETALTTVEDQMPLLDVSLKWLDRESKTLYANTQAFFATLEVNPQGDVKTAVTRFVDEIASSLPFTSSQSSKVALQQMGVVITRLWETLAELNQQVSQPLRTWIVGDQREGLYALLLNPVRNQFLPEIKQLGTHAQSFRMIYNSSLIQSAQLTLDQRRLIRAEIKQAAGANN